MRATLPIAYCCPPGQSVMTRTPQPEDESCTVGCYNKLQKVYHSFGFLSYLTSLSQLATVEGLDTMKNNCQVNKSYILKYFVL